MEDEMQNLAIISILLGSMVLSAFFCIFVRDLLKSAIGLAVLSALLTVVMFLMNAPLAAVFELSVCAGMITVVFISAISLTRTYTAEEKVVNRKGRIKRFILLPVILIAILAAAIWFIWPLATQMLISNPLGPDLSVQDVLWKNRQLEIIGQIIIILAGVFGIVVLFKDRGQEAQ